jgi:hypothetical protein
MDANKLEALRDLSFQIPYVCGTCVHFVADPAVLFGVCDLHEYSHQKHSESNRMLSVPRYGSCNDHEYDTAVVVQLHGFAEFIS